MAIGLLLSYGCKKLRNWAGGLLTYDHYMLPLTNTVLEAWIFLTCIAAKTGKIKIGTVVTPIPFRLPGMLAKIVAILDYLSGGRTILGVGAGWHQPEFEAFSKWAPPGRG